MKIKIELGQELFHFSDPHYGHKNLCEGITEWSKDRGIRFRPFDDLETMNNLIVNNINKTVGEDDILICYGDFAFGNSKNIFEFRERIKCKTIHLIYGNHDTTIKENKKREQSLFTSVDKDHLFSIQYRKEDTSYDEKIKIHGYHFPIASWMEMRRGTIHLHGHLHSIPKDRFVFPGKSLDVGMDGHPEFRPYSTQEVLELMKDRPIITSIQHDHHAERV